jgi:hypothetical protein
MSRAEGSNRASVKPRKPYAPPRLVSYGHVKDVIQGGGGMMSDAAGKPPGGKSKSCWVAEALYGVEDPRTLLLRAWLTVIYDGRRPGWVLIALYQRFGRAAANLIRRGCLPKGPFRRVFDVLVDKALDERARVIVATHH